MRILSLTLVLCLLAAFSNGQAHKVQKEKVKEKKVKPKREDNYIRLKGLRFGMDVTRPFQYLWTKGDRYGTEFSGDLEISPNLFPVFESGYEFMKIKTSYVDYSGQGSYSRFGIDYNFLQAENKNDKNILYGGLRYGFAFASQKVNNYLIDSYWGPTTGSFSNQNYFAQWGEILLGMKGEVFHNFYMGWSIRFKIQLNNKAIGYPPAYFIPGFGKAANGSNFDLTYSVYYNIPWDFRKNIGVKKLKPVTVKAKKEKKPVAKKPVLKKLTD